MKREQDNLEIYRFKDMVLAFLAGALSAVGVLCFFYAIAALIVD